jgi:NAD(P)-dependent dehydrogenase (short-subunit alcohol dehydrogenase family)
VEAVPPTEVRRQFEVNVIGQRAVTQAVLPRLRRTRGRIVFLSSIAGNASYPLHGAHSASKFAIDAFADALRIELRP